ncbi:hypothetical protein HPB50_010553 [Hyalomma asiaticum]|uniref:Uncharacterized protein n=1 Tax=Hyalomma asiaticum TaxID=266040 RepID=A0ACB7TID3_HYAAI|nr:hypothetical protein HPB50_010553 [Hyalomma asiaticum]
MLRSYSVRVKRRTRDNSFRRGGAAWREAHGSVTRRNVPQRTSNVLAVPGSPEVDVKLRKPPPPPAINLSSAKSEA